MHSPAFAQIVCEQTAPLPRHASESAQSRRSHVGRLAVVFGAILLLCAPARVRAQMQPSGRYHGELLPIVACGRVSFSVLKDGRKEQADDGRAEILQAKDFGPGDVTVRNVIADSDPLKAASAEERSAPGHITYRYEADLASDRDLDDCYAVLVYVSESTPQTSLVSVGSLSRGETKHIKVELRDPVDSVDSLHVFSEAREIKSNLVPKSYDVRAYFASLETRTPGVSALSLVQADHAIPLALSANGERLAVARNRDTRYLLTVYDVDDFKMLCEVSVSQYDEHHGNVGRVGDLTWISSTELAYRCREELWVLDIKTQQTKRILKDVLGIRGLVPGPTKVLALYTKLYPAGVGYELYDLMTGHVTDFGELKDAGFFTDIEGRPRLDVQVEPAFDKVRFRYKPSPDSGWESLDTAVKEPGLAFDRSGDRPDTSGLQVLGLSPDARTLYFSAYLGADKRALATLDLGTGRVSHLIARSPKYDVLVYADGQSNVLFTSQRSPFAFVYEAEKPRVCALDPAFAAVQKNMDAKIPDHANIPIAWADTGAAFVYRSISDKDPGTLYLYLPLKGRLMEIDRMGRRFADRKLASVEPMDFTARDGSTIHGYLALPTEPKAGPAPLVVYAPNGPASRWCWSYDPLVQFLATRGYAVAIVNYRGCSGYGLAYQEAGLKARLDTVIVDDLADAARELVAKGVADPKRIAVYGYRFGGWAAYMSLIRHPDLYAAAVCSHAISHWRGVSGEPYWVRSARMGLGYPSAFLTDRKLRDEEAQIDPYERVAEIKRPVLILQSELNNPEPAREMLHALQRNGTPVESLFIEKEHDYHWAEDNEILMFNAMGEFLRKHLDPGAGGRG